MPIEDFEIQSDLGKGSFGSVVKVTRKEDSSVYAMKQVIIVIMIDQTSEIEGKG